MKEQITDTDRLDFIIANGVQLEWVENGLKLWLDGEYCEYENLRDAIDFAMRMDK